MNHSCFPRSPRITGIFSFERRTSTRRNLQPSVDMPSSSRVIQSYRRGQTSEFSLERSERPHTVTWCFQRKRWVRGITLFPFVYDTTANAPDFELPRV